VEHLKGASLRWALASLANIRLSWKGLPGVNTLAYYGLSVNYWHKKFLTLYPDNKVLLTPVLRAQNIESDISKNNYVALINLL